jgi:hypothetical protein
MCIQIRNTSGCYLKIICKNFVYAEDFEITKIFGKTKIFREIFRENGKCSRKPSWEQIFRENFRETWRKASEFSLFAKMKKGSFVSTLVEGGA